MEIKRFELKLFGINTYVVWDVDTKDCAIIDPGMIDAADCKVVDDFIIEKGLHPTHLIYTHTHIDHVAGHAIVTKRYGLHSYGNEKDNMLAQRVKQQAAMFGLPDDMFEDFNIEHYLSNGDTVKIGNGELKVLEVPGHSPGSIALYDKKDGWVITGDALFADSIGRTDLPGGNHTQLIESIKNRLLTLPPQTKVYPGHGPSTTIGAEKLYNPFLR